MDNRPLKWEEFTDRIGRTVYLSATPGDYELGRVQGDVVEQVIRPTGLVDPEVVVKPTKGQIDDLVHEIRVRTEKDERTLVTTLTKKMAEDLTDYLLEYGFKVRYLHSEVDTLDRKSTRLNSSHANISYAVFCLKKKQPISLLEHHRRHISRANFSSPIT